MKRCGLRALLVGAMMLGAPLGMVGCGDNLFSSFQKKNEKDKGKTALQNGDYDEAIDYLQEYLRDNPEDAQARGMLATALLKKTGIDELQLASKIANASKSGGNDWQSIVSVMPEGSPQNIANLELAVETLSAIPPESRTKEQNYQLAVASASLAVAVVKKTAVDETGTYNPTPEALATMTDEEASLVVSSIATTAEAGAAVGQSSEGLSKLTSISEQIHAQPGSTDREKLEAYLIAKR